MRLAFARVRCVSGCVWGLQGVKLRLNWASRPKAANGEEPLLGAEAAPLVAKPIMPSDGGGGGGGGAAAGAGGGGGEGVAVAAAAAPAARAEAYPGQFLGLPPPPGFMHVATFGSGGTGPLRTEARGPRAHPYYPSMNPQAMGARVQQF